MVTGLEHTSLAIMGVEKRFTGPARLASWAPNMDVIVMVTAEGFVACAKAAHLLLRRRRR